MPKIKSNKSAAKRFRCTAGGSYRRSKAYASHILTKKSAKRKRNLRQGGLVSPADTPRVKRLVPYG